MGQQVGKEIAEGVIISAAEEAWYEGTKLTWKKFLLDTSLSGISSGGHETGKTIMEDWIAMVINEGLKRKPAEMAFDLTKEAAKKGAMEEFTKQSYKLIARDAAVSVLKGGINLNRGEDRI